MKNRLKLTLAVAALQFFAAYTAAAPARADGARGAAMSQKGGARAGQNRGSDALTPGVWGGQHIRFEVTGRGAHIEYDCAHGTIEGRIVVDRRGRFSVSGMHFEEHGGPVRAGGESAGYPVRLSGVVGGSLMKLTVTRAGTRKVVGTFSLGRDREPELVKCR